MPASYRVAAVGRGRGLLAHERGRRHLAAGHAVYRVVHEDGRELLAAVGGMDDLGRAYGGEVAVALVADHEVVGQHALDAGGGRGCAPVGGLDGVEVEVEVGPDRAADGIE